MLRRTWWGNSLGSLLGMYKALIKGSMEYGSLVFPYNNHSIMSSPDKIQFRTIGLCLGLKKNTSTNIILVEAGEDPLSMKCGYLTSKYVLKIFFLDTHPAVNKLYDLF